VNTALLRLLEFAPCRDQGLSETAQEAAGGAHGDFFASLHQVHEKVTQEARRIVVLTLRHSPLDLCRRRTPPFHVCKAMT